MAELGLMPGDHVLLCAENRIDWAVADLAIMAIGCVVVPAYTTNTKDDHAWLIDHSQVKLVICCAGKVGDSLAKVLGEQVSVANMILMDQAAAKFQRPKNISVHFLDDIYGKLKHLVTVYESNMYKLLNEDQELDFIRIGIDEKGGWHIPSIYF